MAARFVVDPGTATRTAKNVHAVPGRPNQPTQDLKGKPMVGARMAGAGGPR